MLSTLASRSTLFAGLLALALIAPLGAQSYTLTKSQGPAVGPHNVGGGPVRRPIEEQAMLIGTWTDSSTAALGSMSGHLFDGGGQLTYLLAADVSEYIATGTGQRFGGISGQLYLGIVPSGILVDGTWTIDEDSNEGSFQLTYYMGGQTPSAPVLLLGTAQGTLSTPISTGQEPASAPVVRDALGTWGSN